MCTVSYLATSTSSFILTSNRDEANDRLSALPFKEYEIGAKRIYFPKDQQANGTWIAHDPKGYTVCLLNGAFEKHELGKTYRLSRGLMVLDFFSFSDATNFANTYRFEGIEPFTLVLINRKVEVELYELRWDGMNISFKILDSQKSYIWSSATLYSQKTRNLRENWFATWLEQNSKFGQSEILNFHHFEGGESSKTNIIFEDLDKKTVSISSIDCSSKETKIIYKDLKINKEFQNLIFQK